MILYNVTVNVDHSACESWLQWMKEVHIPEVLATGYFVQARIARILAEEEGGKAYSIQYYAKTMDDYENYQRHAAAKLQQDHQQKFGTKTVAFRTLLQILHEINE